MEPLIMDRLETYNLTIVNGTTEQNCSYANPSNSIYYNIDATDCFFNGGAINIYSFKMTQSKICAKTLETPFPVLGCEYNQRGIVIQPSQEYRSVEECATLLGIERPEAGDGFAFPNSIDWASPDTYANTPAYDYWLSRKEQGDTGALNPNYPFTNFWDRCEISFYGKPFGVCGLFGYVNGGYMHCHSFDWSSWDLDVLQVMVDTGSWQSSPQAGESNYATTRQRMEINFTNDQIFPFEQKKLANFVRPLPKRLSFVDLTAYVIDISAGDRGHIPGEQKILSPYEIDWGSLGNVEWGYGSVTCRADVAGGGLLSIGTDANSVSIYHFDVNASEIQIVPELEIDAQSSVIARSMRCDGSVTLMNFSVISVSSVTIGETFTMESLSRAIIRRGSFQSISAVNSVLVSEDKWTVADQFSATDGCSLQGNTFEFNDDVTIEGSSIKVQKITAGNLTLESTTASIGVAEAGDTWSITNGSNVTIGTLVGPMPDVDETSTLTITN